MTKEKIISFRVDNDDHDKIHKQKERMKFNTVAEFFMYLWDKFKREQKI